MIFDINGDDLDAVQNEIINTLEAEGIDPTLNEIKIVTRSTGEVIPADPLIGRNFPTMRFSATVYVNEMDSTAASELLS